MRFLKQRTLKSTIQVPVHIPYSQEYLSGEKFCHFHPLLIYYGYLTDIFPMLTITWSIHNVAQTKVDSTGCFYNAKAKVSRLTIP